METILVGIIGFAGVMLTLWYNGKLAREQREEERNHERETLRAGFIEELKINRTALRESAKMLKEKPPKKTGGAYVPTDPLEDVYRALVPRIGLLSKTEVSKVINAYLALRTYNGKLFLLGVPVETSPRHVKIPAKNVATLAAMQESFIEPIDDAIDALSQSGGV